jgi:molybdopterin/thiamine biosynthesis adenylyltransferase
VRLSDAQQERYARHLLLDGIGGEGQERLLASSVRVRGTGRAARACALYLAASGVGGLAVDGGDPGRDLFAVSPDLRLLSDADGVDLEIAPADPAASGPAEAAAAGSWAALEAVRVLAGPR